MRPRIVVVLAFVCFVNGCATLFAKRSDTITIKTVPDGADVYDGVVLLGKTPLTHTFKRDAFVQKTLQIRAPGFTTYELSLQRTLDLIALFNLGFSLTTMGATSWGIDASSGAMIRYEPTSYFVDLQPAGQERTSIDRNRSERFMFVLNNHQALTRDIAQGDGPYLASYYRLLTPEAQDYPQFVRQVKDASADLLAQDDPVDFTRHLDVLTRAAR
ncbi:MAG: hypothetical protein ACOYXR_04285 [Nitrospirota bacterium]